MSLLVLKVLAFELESKKLLLKSKNGHDTMEVQ